MFYVYEFFKTGVLSISTCSPGLVFDTTAKACNDPAKVSGSCGSGTTLSKF